MERTRPPQLTADETQQVLRRAAQIERPREHASEPSLDLAEVERIGLEAGLSREAIQRAFVELRTGALRESPKAGAADRILGPPLVEVQRLLRDPPETARKRVYEILKSELLHPEERSGTRTTWSPAPGLWAAIQRGLNWEGQGQWRRGSVVSEVTPAPPGVDAQSVVRLEARPGVRAAYLTAALAPGLSLLPVSILTTFTPGAPIEIPVMLGAMSLAGTGLGLVFSRRAYKKRLRTLRQAIERVLDKLGADPDPWG